MPTRLVESVRRALAGVHRNEPRRVLIVGAAGSGKGTAIEAALGEAKRSGRFYVLEFTPDPFQVPYLPVVRAVQQFVLVHEHREHDRRLAVDVAFEMARLAPVLGQAAQSILRIVKDNWPKPPPPITSHVDIERQIKEVLVKLSHARPTILVLHDVQRYDLSSLGIVASIFEDRSLPLSYAITTEGGPDDAGLASEILATLRAYPGVTTIASVPFTTEETATYLEQNLQVRVHQDDVEKVRGLTGGNALFLRELVDYFWEDAKILQTPDGARIDGLSKIDELPSTLASAIDKRLNRLQRELRDTIDVASVLGPEFNSLPIAGVLRIEHLVVLKRLREIERIHDLIQELEQSHRFTHELVRARVYELLGPALAREHHLLIAKYLEGHPMERDNEYALFFHYDKAGKGPEALKYLVLAARESRARLCHADASRRFREAALRLRRKGLPDAVLADEFDVESGVSLYDAGAYPDAIRQLKPLMASAADKRLRGRAVQFVGKAEYFDATYDEAISTLAHFLRSDYGLGAPAAASVRLALASAYYHRGSWEEARKQYRKVFAGPGLDQQGVRRQAIKRINMFYLPELALPTLARTADDARAEGELDLYSEMRHNIGCNHFLLGDLTAAREAWTEALAYFRSVASHKQAYPVNNLAIVSAIEGDFRGARSYADAVIRRPLSDFDAVSAEITLAVVDTLTGDPDGGLVRLAPLWARAANEPILLDILAFNRAWILERLGRHHEALKELERVPDHVDEPWDVLRLGQRRRMEERLRYAAQPVENGSRSPELLDRTGRKDAWLFRDLDFQVSEVWFWE